MLLRRTPMTDAVPPEWNFGYPPVAFYFSVNIGSVINPLDASFQDVSGLALSMETEDYSEGGENRYIHRLPKGVQQQKLRLKRGISSLSSPLVQWCKSVLEGGLSAPILPQTVLISLLSPDLTALRMWSLTNAFPLGWEIDAFNSEKSEVAIEQIELAYLTMTRTL